MEHVTSQQRARKEERGKVLTCESLERVHDLVTAEGDNHRDDGNDDNANVDAEMTWVDGDKDLSCELREGDGERSSQYCSTFSCSQ